MKKLVGLFLWFCAATFLAQVCILGLAASKGNVSRQTIAQVIGSLNGIDIQGERLKQALISARDTPTPSYQEILVAKSNALLQLDYRSRVLDNFKRQIEDQQRELQKKIEDFDERRKQYELQQEKERAGSQLDSLKEIQTILESMAPEEAKKQLIKKLGKGELADVVSIIRGLSPDKKKKILAEFTQQSDVDDLAKVLEEIRRGQASPTFDPIQKSP
ncbi:MAG TPA: hypothetical protein VM260_07400 [Pirellula sp.]|nr:hypothetical protein [Pirellula sp.]